MNPSPPSPVSDSAAPAWAPGSWRDKPALQLPVYPDQSALQAAMDELGQLPPLVT
ncbi:3-deoxy-7-phosphoheptulonate synthase, partial [Xanthomonas vesicatoria]